MLKYLPFLLISFSALAEEDFTDFLNSKTSIAVCSSFITEAAEALPIKNAKRNGKYQTSMRFSWDDLESNKVIIYREDKLVHVFHFANSKNLKIVNSEDEKLDMRIRIRHHVLMETKNIKDKNLEQFYSSLNFDQVFKENPKRPEGWEVLAENISTLSHGKLFNSSKSCDKDCLITFVIDKNASDLQIAEKCEDRVYYLFK